MSDHEQESGNQPQPAKKSRLSAVKAEENAPVEGSGDENVSYAIKPPYM